MNLCESVGVFFMSHGFHRFTQIFALLLRTCHCMNGMEVSASRTVEMISAIKTLKSKEDEILNYFVNRATNDVAESLNSKMKGFGSEFRGVCDLPFYLFRCSRIFG